MKSKLGIELSWVLVFILGAVAGAVGHSIYRQHVKPAVASVTPSKPGVILDRMASELQLDPPQTESLKSIFAQSRQKYRALGQQYRPQWEAIRKDTDEQIRQILRADQKVKFEEFLKKVNAPSRRQPQPAPSAPK